MGKGGVPYLATHDGRTIRYPDPDIRVTYLSLGPHACSHDVLDDALRAVTASVQCLSGWRMTCSCGRCFRLADVSLSFCTAK